MPRRCMVNAGYRFCGYTKLKFMMSGGVVSLNSFRGAFECGPSTVGNKIQNNGGREQTMEKEEGGGRRRGVEDCCTVETRLMVGVTLGIKNESGAYFVGSIILSFLGEI